MRDDADLARRFVAWTEMLVRSKGICPPQRQQQTQPRYLPESGTHEAFPDRYAELNLHWDDRQWQEG
jgi:hypothetical protein